MKLAQQVAIVAGASRGIGLATTAAIAAAGGNVMLTSRSQESSDTGPYNASKAALILLTKQLALGLSPKVRANAVAPGVVRTNLAEALWNEHEEAVSASTALKQIGGPVDIASGVAFLVSDAPSGITGETMVIDEGPLLSDALVFRQGAGVGV